ncbi:cytochrome c3 family protein [Chloroflexota bacterium]
MRKQILWGGVVIGLVGILAFLFASCTGGSGGVAAGGDCTDCHNDTTLVKARQVQWASSAKATGGNFERNGTGCAFCHTNEGFLAGSISADTEEVAMAPENPSPIQCRTCHEIHETYTSTDWALRTTSPVTLLALGETYDKGKSNLCANCHQPREATTPPQVGDGDVEITSTRYGPHHGPQSSMLMGTGGYGDYKGSKVHYDYTTDGCVECHMATPYGAQAGGHSFGVGYEYHEELVPNLAACDSCHSDIEDFDRNGAQTEVQALFDEAEALLVAKGLMEEGGSVIPQTTSSAYAGAVYNWKMIQEDRSLGTHNPAYAKFLLQTAIDALK